MLGSQAALCAAGRAPPRGAEHFARTRGSTSTYLLGNDLGSTIGLTDSTGSLNTQYSYDSYGNVSTSGTSDTNPYKFIGREWEAPYGTPYGLTYARARYYYPLWGRFLSRDPLEFSVSTNFYSYAGNNPVDFKDPTGLQGTPGAGEPGGTGGGGTLTSMGLGDYMQEAKNVQYAPGEDEMLNENNPGWWTPSYQQVQVILPNPHGSAPKYEELRSGSGTRLSYEDVIQGWNDIREKLDRQTAASGGGAMVGGIAFGFAGSLLGPAGTIGGATAGAGLGTYLGWKFGGYGQVREHAELARPSPPPPPRQIGELPPPY